MGHYGRGVNRFRGVNKLTRTVVHGGGIGAEDYIGARSDGWLPATTDGSKSFTTLRQILVRC
jgi:hypothetical protein